MTAAASHAEQDPIVARISETSLRMMAGTIPIGTLERVRGEVEASPSQYPWERVVEAVLADPVEVSDLVQRGLVAQRDWVARAGRPPSSAPSAAAGGGPARRPRSPSGAAHKGKTLLAMAVVRTGIFVLQSVALVLILVLLKHKLPAFDIYVILEWLKILFPGVFGPR